MGLIFDAGMRAFPPRLPQQPIFYPVLNQEYAEQIARDWNTKEDDAAGYVTRFEVPDCLAERYQRQIVGGTKHEEWWVPAEDLVAFNAALLHPITVEAAFFGSAFRGFECTEAGLKGKDATEQFVSLAHHLSYSSFDVWFEIYVNRRAVFLHYLFWQTLQPETVGVSAEQKEKLLSFVEHRWAHSDIPFPLPMSQRGI